MRSKIKTFRIGRDIKTADSFETYPGANTINLHPDGSFTHFYDGNDHTSHLDTDAGFDYFVELIKLGEAQRIENEFKRLLNIKN